MIGYLKHCGASAVPPGAETNTDQGDQPGCVAHTSFNEMAFPESVSTSRKKLGGSLKDGSALSKPEHNRTMSY